MSKKISSGVVTALITPFKNQDIDWESLEKLVEDQVRQGVDGFVVNGTTAESPSLSVDEVKRIYSFVKERAKDKTLILGAGLNSTHKTIELHTQFASLKPDAFLDVVPYYNKPTQEGLFQHFSAVADKSSAPVILYNVPSRTLTSLSTETIARLAPHKNIVGIKEASGDIAFLKEIKASVPESWSLMSGDDETSVEFVSNGGDGSISVLSHICGDLLKALFTLAKEAPVEAQKKFEPLLRISRQIFVEPNPTPVKWSLLEMGIISSAECRLPLLSLSEKYRADLSAETQKVKTLKL